MTRKKVFLALAVVFMVVVMVVGFILENSVSPVATNASTSSAPAAHRHSVRSAP